MVDGQTERASERASNQATTRRAASQPARQRKDAVPSRLTQPLASGNHQCMTIVPRAPLLGPRLVAVAAAAVSTTMAVRPPAGSGWLAAGNRDPLGALLLGTELIHERYLHCSTAMARRLAHFRQGTSVFCSEQWESVPGTNPIRRSMN